MLQLKVFGGLVLCAGEQPLAPVATQRKPLALLALLAVQGNLGISREKVLAYLWPDLDERRAKRALKQLVYMLRRGTTVNLITGTHRLELNPAVCSSDIREFEAALAQGRPLDAAAAHRGKFLDGFFLNGSAEFQEWVEECRSDFAGRARQAFLRVAAAANAGGRHGQAIEFLDRVVRQDRLDTSTALSLIETYHLVGDPVAATRVAKEHCEAVQRELGRPADSRIRALLDESMARVLEERVAGHHAAAPPISMSALAEPAIRGTAQIEEKGHRGRRFWVRIAVLVVAVVGIAQIVQTSTGRGSVRVPSSGTPPRLAIIPFSTVDAGNDGYVAYGIADEVGRRLGGLSSLAVLSWRSTARYRRSDLRPAEIGRLLDAAFVLTAVVHRESTGGGGHAWHLRAALVRTLDSVVLWQERYHWDSSGVMSVPGLLAADVADAIAIPLTAPERHAVRVAPSPVPEAYDLYLRAMDYNDPDRNISEADTRIAVGLLKRAVRLDPEFALAHASLARANWFLYWEYDHSPPRLAAMKQAVDAAMELDSAAPASRYALAHYLYAIYDYSGSMRELEIARAAKPHDPEILTTLGAVKRRQGKWSEAVPDLEEAAVLAPRSAEACVTLAETLHMLRDFAGSASWYERAIDLNPRYVQPRGALIRIRVAQSRLAAARSVLADADALGLGQDPMIVYYGILLDLLGRNFDGAIQRLNNTASDAFVYQFWYQPRRLLLGEVLLLKGEVDSARAYFAQADSLLVARVRGNPTDLRYRAARAIALAGLGRTDSARAMAHEVVDAMPMSRDAFRGMYALEALAWVNTMNGDLEDAVSNLERLLSVPSHLSRNWVRLDPRWDRLRSHPGFQKLVSDAN